MPIPPIPWQPIEPLAAEAEVPDFPTDALPEWLADFIKAESEATQTPESLAGMLSLAALSTATQGRLTAVANRGNWKEIITLYIALAMNPGERKSAVFLEMRAPLNKWEAQMQEMQSAEVAASRQMHKELEANVEATQNEIKKRRAEIRANIDGQAAGDKVQALGADLSAARDRAVEAQHLFDKHREIKPMRLIYDDITPEAAATALYEQRGERIGVLSTEGGIFDILAGRYSEKPALDIFLKGHSADPYSVDRKGRDSEVLKRPVITLGLAVQPAVLQNIGKSKDMHGRGLLARFLYCVPISAIGDREIDVDPIPARVASDFDEKLRQIASSAYEAEETQSIYLNEAADALFMDYQRALEPRLRPEEGDLDPLIEWASKLAGAILRIAALIATARQIGIPNEINEDDMTAAITFGPYLEAHAWRAYATMGLVEHGTTIEAKIMRRIIRMGWAEFTTRELRRAMNLRDFTTDDVDEILRSLENRHHMLREILLNTNGSRSKWLVNPEVYT